MAPFTFGLVIFPRLVLHGYASSNRMVNVFIAVPAAMRLSVPQANPGIYLPLSLAITFPFNISLGIPLYYFFINTIWG